MRQESTLYKKQGVTFPNPFNGQSGGRGRNKQKSAPRLDFDTATFRSVPSQLVIGLILVIALVAFEVFNFDSTQFALADLLGQVSFMGLRWATILAIAFCFIDFAGLAYLFSPDRSGDQPKEAWYMMGAWLLGATMNALMTWWAVSVTLLSHDFGNEVLSRDQLLHMVPIFVAVLVWLTRILFIGAFSVAGNHLFGFPQRQKVVSNSRKAATKQPKMNRPVGSHKVVTAQSERYATDEVPEFLEGQADRQVPEDNDLDWEKTIPDAPIQVIGNNPETGRVNRRPPRPAARQPLPMAAKPVRRPIR